MPITGSNMPSKMAARSAAPQMGRGNVKDAGILALKRAVTKAMEPMNASLQPVMRMIRTSPKTKEADKAFVKKLIYDIINERVDEMFKAGNPPVRNGQDVRRNIQTPHRGYGACEVKTGPGEKTDREAKAKMAVGTQVEIIQNMVFLLLLIMLVLFGGQVPWKIVFQGIIPAGGLDILPGY